MVQKNFEDIDDLIFGSDSETTNSER